LLLNLYKTIGRKLFFAVGPEQAHGLSIAALKFGVHPRFDAAFDPALQVNMAGLAFPNPLGMAAGYDKNADVPDALLAMGFGHMGVGTITPKPQPGNPKPRLFRLTQDGGVINRLGFNSDGHRVAHNRLELRAARKQVQRGIVGVNIGANKASEDFAADYVAGIHAFASLADYFTINISSPNTPGLRGLQNADPLGDLLSRVGEARAEAVNRHGRSIPLFLKIAPDLDEQQMDVIANTMAGSDFDAVVVSNTTLSREGLSSQHRHETGGLSGKPLFERSTIVLAKMYQRVSVPLIGVGGVFDAATAFSKLEAGASLVQLYSGMVYQGPGLPGAIVQGLSARLKQDKLTGIGDVTGRDADNWARKNL